MIKTITNIDFFDDVALVSINNIPNHVKNIAGILNIIGNNGISIDMISQSAPHKDKINISFTLSQDDLGEVVVATQEFKKLSPMISTDVNGNNTKILLKGEGMRSEFGVAAELFTILSDNDIQVKLITTAETEISCLIDIKDVDKAKEILKK
ncbi:MAG: ACT domain-containing protein [Oscillospiraceae bacterium]